LQDVSLSAAQGDLASGRLAHECAADDGQSMVAPSEVATLRVPPEEFGARRTRLSQALRARQLDGLVLFHPVRIRYLTGFHPVQTERPVVLVVCADDSLALLIPLLEQEHAASLEVELALVRSYPEYPGGRSRRHPMLHLLDLLSDKGLDQARLAADHDGYLDVWGYVGPSLGELIGRDIVVAADVVDGQRQVKSDAELHLMRESCRWADEAHRILQDRLMVGVTEIEASLEATLQATQRMLSQLGPAHVTPSRDAPPAQAGLIAGSNTALPHGMRKEAGLQPGDVIITGATALIGGYRCELERTMFVGRPDERFRRYFDAMLAAQQAGFDALRPGRTCSDVEADVVRAVERMGFGDLIRHHTGHGLGLEPHEQPFIDLSDDTEIAPGMVFSVEPGLYVPGYAGFRHSDTAIVTQTGCEVATRYPRDLDSLVVLTA
jgi:Xaa-Pro aminopeptidase